MPNYKSFKLINHATHKIYNFRNVVFDKGETTPHKHVIIDDHNNNNNNNAGHAPAPMPPHVTSAESTPHPKRAICAPSPICASIAKADLGSDPRTFNEAMAQLDTTEWELACKDKYHTFDHMGIYEIVPYPHNHKIVGSRWVFHVKRGPDGSIQKYKAHIVAQGFMQVEGIDFNETFALVAKLISLCIILVITAEKDLVLHQMDVKSVYLNGTLREEIFMSPPLGFDVPDSMVF